VVLYRIFPLLPDEFLTRSATSRRQTFRAAVFVAVVFIYFYDLFALRTIGRKDVPYRVAALSRTFTSYSTTRRTAFFTGGAVR